MTCRSFQREAHTSGSVFSSGGQVRAHDVHRAAAILTLLVFLWGAISLVLVPWEPFWIPNLGQAVVCAGGILYFVATWKRPRADVSYVVLLTLIVYALALLPWTAVMWTSLGRPLEAFVVPHVGAVTMALIFPGRLWLGLVAMSLFVADGMFVFVYARYAGAEATLPINEPLATFCFGVLGVAIFMLRRRRQELAQRYVDVQAELDALDRTRPVLTRAREGLAGQLDAFISSLESATGPGPSPGLCRAVDRLGTLSEQLRRLLDAPTQQATTEQAERALLERDAYLGAMTLAAVSAVAAVPMTLWARTTIGSPLSWILAGNLAVQLVVLLDLVRTRRRPSSQRSLCAILVIFATALLTTDYVQYLLVEHSRRFIPFLGHKLLMCILGLTLTARLRASAVLVVLTGANALALWFLLELEAGVHISASEPWVTLIYMAIGLACLRMNEQREIAAVQLLRAEAKAAALHRRARMFLALRDRLNGPLQTLVLASPALELPDRDRERMNDAVCRLVGLSHELAELDSLAASVPPTFDADRELRRFV